MQVKNRQNFNQNLQVLVDLIQSCQPPFQEATPNAFLPYLATNKTSPHPPFHLTAMKP